MSSMNGLIAADRLPLPIIYKGGYIHSDEIVGILMGQALPQSVRWARPGNDVECGADNIAALNAAPEGSVYVTRETLRDGDVDCRVYRKTGHLWAEVQS